MSQENEEYVRTLVGLSFTSKIGKLILSVQETSSSRVSFVVGRTGFPNVLCGNAKVGEAVLFETYDDGIVEVRFYHHHIRNKLVFRIARVAPAKGITGGLLDIDPQNAPFEQAEIARIGECMETVKEAVRQRSDLVRPEQMEFLAKARRPRGHSDPDGSERLDQSCYRNVDECDRRGGAESRRSEASFSSSRGG